MNKNQKVFVTIGVALEIFFFFVRPVYEVYMGEKEFGFATISTIQNGYENSIGFHVDVVTATNYWLGIMFSVALLTILCVTLASDTDSK
ncbi:hypothetical protein GGP65_002113 [Salinibacter ruber]|jgi:hypothetical protein|nr:hypothetical protein [Salinibacter ruber]